jgi:hypothetical protein
LVEEIVTAADDPAGGSRRPRQLSEQLIVLRQHWVNFRATLLLTPAGSTSAKLSFSTISKPTTPSPLDPKKNHSTGYTRNSISKHTAKANMGE